MIPLEELTAGDKSFLSTMRDQGVSPTEAMSRLEAVRPATVPAVKPGFDAARGFEGVKQGLGDLAGRIGSGIAGEFEAGAGDIRKGIAQAGTPKGPSFVENVEAGLTGGMNAAAGLSKMALSPITGLVGGIAQPFVERASTVIPQNIKYFAGKKAYDALKGGVEGVANAYDSLPEGVKAVGNLGGQALNFVGAGEAKPILEGAATKIGQAVEGAGQVATDAAGAVKGAVGDALAVPGKIKAGLEVVASKLSPLKAAEDVLDTVAETSPGLKDQAKQWLRHAIQQESGLSDHTIGFAVNNPEDYAKVIAGDISKEGTIGEVVDAFKKAQSEISTSGKEYGAIRQSPSVFQIPQETIDSTLAKNGLKVGLDGNVAELSPHSSNLMPEDMKVVQDALNIVNRNPVPTAGEYLNMRQKLDDLVNWESKVSDKAEAMVKQLRGAINSDARETIGGLGALDDKFSKQVADFGQFRNEYFQKAPDKSWVLKDNAASKIMNLGKANRQAVLARLESKVPGISKKIEALAVMDDMANAAQSKVGNYRKGLVSAGLGGAVGSIFGPAGTIAGGLMGYAITNPRTAIELIQKYAPGLWAKDAIAEVVGKINKAIPLTKTEAGMIENTVRAISGSPENLKALETYTPFKGIMNPNRPEPLLKVEMDLMSEMDASAKGERIFTPSEIGGGSDVSGIKSTFPDWVPENLRKKELFDRVSSKLVDGKPMKGANEKQLLDAMQSEAKKRLGLDGGSDMSGDPLPDFLSVPQKTSLADEKMK